MDTIFCSFQTYILIDSERPGAYFFNLIWEIETFSIFSGANPFETNESLVYRGYDWSSLSGHRQQCGKGSQQHRVSFLFGSFYYVRFAHAYCTDM